MAQAKPDACLCRNVRIADAISFIKKDEKKPYAVWHKDCPIHIFITGDVTVRVKEPLDTGNE